MRVCRHNDLAEGVAIKLLRLGRYGGEVIRTVWHWHSCEIVNVCPAGRTTAAVVRAPRG